MSDIHEDLRSLLGASQAFLRQQRELYGEDLPLMPAVPVAEAPVVAAPAAAVPIVAVPELPMTPAANEPWSAAASVQDLNAMICDCQKCGLGRTRTKFVFGVGNPQADVVIIGEAPGADEDAQGEPFVGRAGQLLNKILEAVQFKRDEVYICNILKCRPPENRRPTPEEVALCEPYLWKQLEIIKPKMILALGLTAGQSLLKTNQSLGQLRGKFFDYRGIQLMVTYHPAALLRNPNWKRPTWEDVQLFRRTYDELKNH